MEICQKKRGQFKDMQYLDENRVNITYEIPLSEIVYDFFDQLKSQTKGYASFDYDFKGYQVSNLVKMDILLNGESVDALSFIVHRDFAFHRGKHIAEKLKKITQGNNLKCRFKRQSVIKLLLGRQSKPCVKTFYPNVTVETFRERENYWRNKKKVRNE